MADIYFNWQNLAHLTWYGVIGNTDYNYWDIRRQLSQSGKEGTQFRIDNYIWTHSMKVEGHKVAFIHIDTSFLAYGKKGEANNLGMKQHFREYRWTDEFVLNQIETALADNRDARYKIAVGHHPICHLSGGSHAIL